MTVDRGVDTPPPTGTDDDIAPRIRAAADAGELRGVTTGLVERLGTGESYTAWRVGSGEQARVLRLPRRPPHDLPRSMQAEFEVLRRVPPELGTSAVALEPGSDNPLGTPYMVTTHVPGRALRTADWNPRFATALAHQIARLHEALATATATAPTPSAAFVPSADEQGEDLATWWGEHHPQTLTDPRVRELLPAWRRELDRSPRPSRRSPSTDSSTATPSRPMSSSAPTACRDSSTSSGPGPATPPRTWPSSGAG